MKGSRDSSVLEQWTYDRKGRRFKSWEEQWENFPTLLFQYSFHPHVTTVACKRSWSFCQKCRWQVTTKYACPLCMWPCMKWHDMVQGCMVDTELAITAAVSCGTSHRTCHYSSSFMWHQPCNIQQCRKNTASVDIKKMCYKKLQSLI